MASFGHPEMTELLNSTGSNVGFKLNFTSSHECKKDSTKKFTMIITGYCANENHTSPMNLTAGEDCHGAAEFSGP